MISLHNGRGIGICAQGLQTVYFVDWDHERAGYSLWPARDGGPVRYPYYVERGRDEVISRGKLVANPPGAMLVDGRADG